MPSLGAVSDQSQGPGWWLASDARWYPPESHPSYRPAPPATPLPAGRRRPWLIGLVVVVALLGAVAAFLAGLAVDSPAPARRGSTLQTLALPQDVRLPRDLDPPPSLPTATLTVFSDGCGVIRSELPVMPPNLTWSISDVDGFEVLGRGAEGETRYRYFRPGTYTVVLKAFDGRTYVPVSNPVTIRC